VLPRPPTMCVLPLFIPTPLSLVTSRSQASWSSTWNVVIPKYAGDDSLTFRRRHSKLDLVMVAHPRLRCGSCAVNGRWVWRSGDFVHPRIRIRSQSLLYDCSSPVRLPFHVFERSAKLCRSNSACDIIVRHLDIEDRTSRRVCPAHLLI